ncbi:MAG: hypothetical protein K0R15_559 [Clostridiales bacterium]|jgi:hypothetical protein|nr:hypothetical protein [Clostridiales bacterium]
MNRLENILNEKNGNRKIIIITKITCSIIVIILALIQLIGIWDKAIYINEPLLGIVMLIQAIEHWEKNRKLAIFSLGVSLFVFVCAIVIFVNIISKS